MNYSSFIFNNFPQGEKKKKNSIFLTSKNIWSKKNILKVIKEIESIYLLMTKINKEGKRKRKKQ